MATTGTILTLARLTAITGLTGSMAACSSAPVRGTAGAGRATGDVAGGAAGVAAGAGVRMDLWAGGASLAAEALPADADSRMVRQADFIAVEGSTEVAGSTVDSTVVVDSMAEAADTVAAVTDNRRHPASL